MRMLEGDALVLCCRNAPRFYVRAHQLKRATIDTNILPADDFTELAKSRRWEIKIVSVTEREMGHGDRRLQVSGLGKVLERAVWDESEWDDCVFGVGDDFLENIIQIISNGSFPKAGCRGQLSDGQSRQLRDAMILEAHAREEREIFVTNDRTGFIDDGRREKLQNLLKTRILTREEFLHELKS